MRLPLGQLPGRTFRPTVNGSFSGTDRKRTEYLQFHAIRIDGSHDVALTENEGVNWGPYWHPTQPLIIWAGADHSDPSQHPNYDLWMLPYEVMDGRLQGTGEPLRVTDHPSADVLPVFSPEGRRTGRSMGTRGQPVNIVATSLTAIYGRHTQSCSIAFVCNWQSRHRSSVACRYTGITCNGRPWR